ncbi:MAG: hypothetical protein MK036_03290 [Dehalococcoidia bacterium]|nr:hypothetical protein [Dehalococcoidia bacterium]
MAAATPFAAAIRTRVHNVIDSKRAERNAIVTEPDLKRWEPVAKINED